MDINTYIVWYQYTMEGSVVVEGESETEAGQKVADMYHNDELAFFITPILDIKKLNGH